MERRSQRHDVVDNNVKKSRISKNEYLYDDINNKIGFEEIVSLDSNSKINLSNLSNINNREDYHKVKDYKDIINFEKEKEIVEKKEEVKKVYDINSILEDAKKNRAKYDELERKRKLKENDYVSLANLNDKEKYKTKDIDEDELKNLIDTITSHNLLNEIKQAEGKPSQNEEKEIFSDLLAAEDEENNMEGIAKEFTKNDDKDKVDNSFYTKSLDLSKQDFEFSDEIEEERKTTIKIVSVIAIIIVIILIVIFFILKSKNMI
ncbi:MAG: hypothetical protein PUD59_01515 [bacterium]|nr:hypothetical protein [bacterium]